jgi:hypothetical protein
MKGMTESLNTNVFLSVLFSRILFCFHVYCTASDRPSNQRQYSAKSHPVPHQPDIKERVEINILLIAFIVEIIFSSTDQISIKTPNPKCRLYCCST